MQKLFERDLSLGFLGRIDKYELFVAAIEKRHLIPRCGKVVDVSLAENGGVFADRILLRRSEQLRDDGKIVRKSMKIAFQKTGNEDDEPGDHHGAGAAKCSAHRQGLPFQWGFFAFLLRGPTYRSGRKL